MRRLAGTRDRAAGRRGSVLPVCLVIVAGVGAAMTTFLGRTVVEQNRILLEAAVERSAWRAIGEIELAKNVIQASTYTDGFNDVIALAAASDPPLIEGTSVAIERVGPDRWYRLTSSADFGGTYALAQCMVRDGLSYVAYNYYVENHNLGISGKPKGRIHTNQTLELYFAGGVYDGYVSAGNGFTYRNGATPENTSFLDGTDPSCAPKDLLSRIDYDQLLSGATYVAPPAMVAEIKLKKDLVEIALFEADSVQQVPVQKSKQVQIGTERRPVTKTRYEKQWQWVDVEKTKKTWVETSGGDAGGGTDVAGGGGATGYWLTEKYTETVWKQVNVAVGTYETWEWVAVYETQTFVELVDQTVAGQLVDKFTLPAAGIFYFPDTVRSIFGDLDGKITIVSGSSVTITNHLRYVDSGSHFAFLNGGNPSDGEYVPNPKFVRDHALGIIAKGDIRYSLHAPSNLEINANLITTGGMVGMEGIALDADGNPYGSGKQSVKSSLCRFGTLMSLLRPVATLLDANGNVIHGFRAGASEYDRFALSDPPPGFPNEEELTFLDVVRIEPGNYTPAGAGAPGPGVAPIDAGLMDVEELRDLTTLDRFDWGVEDYKDSLQKIDAGLKSDVELVDPITGRTINFRVDVEAVDGATLDGSSNSGTSTGTGTSTSGSGSSGGQAVLQPTGSGG